MTLDQALAYLETTSRVSCPQITCDQAREIAGLMRDLADQHQVDIAEVIHERDEARAKLREAERECDEAKAECERERTARNHWKSQAEVRLAMERTASEFSLMHQVAKDKAWSAVADEQAAHERTKQEACGYAWDLGAEMARPEGERRADEFMAWLHKHGEHWKDKDWRKELGREIEVGEDFDADDYAKPGRK